MANTSWRKTPLKRLDGLSSCSSSIQRKPLPKRRVKPRQGRAVDRDYLAFIARQPCLICGRRSTVHHVRECGSPKDDRRTLPLCPEHHLIQFGPRTSIEALGKKKFEKYHGVALNDEMERYGRVYDCEGKMTKRVHPIMALIACALLLSMAALAQQPALVNGVSLVAPSFTGSATVACPASRLPNGQYAAASSQSVTVVAGQLSIAEWPTEWSVPVAGTPCTVTYVGAGTGGANVVTQWVIPATAAGRGFGVGSIESPVVGSGGGGTSTTQQSGAGAVSRAVVSKLNDIYNLNDYGGNCNGAFDNTTPFANAIAAIVANGGGRLQTPPGTCLTGTINLPDPGNLPLWIQGAGVDATTVKLKNATNADLFTQSDFSTLTGTNSPGGVFRLHLSDMTIDGNKANQTGVSWPLRLFNHGSSFENLIVQNGLTGGIYSEWGTDSTFATTAQDLEDSFTNIKAIFNGTGVSPSTVTFAFAAQGAAYLHYITIGANTYYYQEQSTDTAASVASSLVLAVNDPNANATATGASSVVLTASANSGVSQAVSASDGNTSGSLPETQIGDGILFRGPHDTVMENVIAYQNTGWGFHNQTHGQPTSPAGVYWNGGGLHISHLNTYLDTLGGAFNEDGIICQDCAFTTATGPGQLLPYYAGATSVTNGTWASWYGYGLDCANANNNLEGFFGNSNTTTTGIFFNGCELSHLTFNFFDINGPLLYVRGGTQNNIIKINGEANLFGTPGVLGSTTLFDPRGIQGFPLNNCVELNIGGPLGALATKYGIPCNGVEQIDNANQFLGVNAAPLFPLDVMPPQPSSYTFGFSNTGTPPLYATGTGYVHNITVGSSVYNYTQLSGDTSGAIATALAGAVNAGPDPNVTATVVNAQYVKISAKLDTGAVVVVSASDWNGSTTITENYHLYQNTARLSNPLTGVSLQIGQEVVTNPTNLFISMQTASSAASDLWFLGPSSIAIPNFYTYAENVQLYNNDSTGYLSFGIHGGTAQSTNPFFTVYNRAGSKQFEVNSSGQLCAFSGSCISAWPSGGGGAVSSVFGRTGAVTAATNDYNLGQIGLGTFAATTGSTITTSAVSTQLLFTQSDLGTSTPTNILVSTQPGGGVADFWIDGPSSTSFKNFYVFSNNPQFVNNDATGYTSFLIQGGTAQSTNPFFTVKNRSGVNQFQVTSAGQLCAFGGSCISAWPSGGGGAVSSVFGRTGAVTAASGDYTAAQVTNAMSLSPAAAQTVYNSGGSGLTQINIQESSSQGGASEVGFFNNANTKCGFMGASAGWASGDCVNYKFGSSGNSMFFSQDMVLGWKNNISAYAGAYDTGLARESPGGILKVTNGSSGYGTLDAGALLINGSAPAFGAGMSAQLGDLAIVPTSGTVLTVGAGCASATPCNVRFGQQTYHLITSATITNGGGTGTVYVYVTSDGVLNAGYTGLTLTCSAGCTAVSGVTTYPVDTVPVGSWTDTATAGTWDTAGGTDARGWLAAKVIVANTGIIDTKTAGADTLSVDVAGLQMVTNPILAGGTLAATLASLGTVTADITSGGNLVANGTVAAGSGTTTDGALHLGCGAAAAYDCSLSASGSSTGNVAWTLPAADGTSNQVLVTNGAGQFGWFSLGGASLGGDVTGTDAANTVVKVNGAALPVSAAFVAANSSGQLVAQTKPYYPVIGGCDGLATNDLTLALNPFQVASGSCTANTSWAGPPFRASVFSNLYVAAKTGPYSTLGGAVTVYFNGVASAITCTLPPGSAPSCNDTTDTHSIAAGTQVSIKFTTGGTLTAGPTWSSGGTSCTNGTQTVTFSNFPGSAGTVQVSATGTITVSGGVPTGAVTVTSPGGFGYAVGSPPTAGQVATCTGASVFTGGTVTADTVNSVYATVEVQ